MSRIDPGLFADCFSSWVAECWPDKPRLVAIDGKTSRRSHDRKRGQKALHPVSAFATSSQLVLEQKAVDEKKNEITAIPAHLERIDLEDALASIDAMGCNPNITEHPRRRSRLSPGQPKLHARTQKLFEKASSGEIERFQTLGKDHGRLEMRTHTVSHIDRRLRGPKLGQLRHGHLPENSPLDLEQNGTGPQGCQSMSDDEGSSFQLELFHRVNDHRFGFEVD